MTRPLHLMNLSWNWKAPSVHQMVPTSTLMMLSQCGMILHPNWFCRWIEYFCHHIEHFYQWTKKFYHCFVWSSHWNHESIIALNDCITTLCCDAIAALNKTNTPLDMHYWVHWMSLLLHWMILSLHWMLQWICFIIPLSEWTIPMILSSHSIIAPLQQMNISPH